MNQRVCDGEEVRRPELKPITERPCSTCPPASNDVLVYDAFRSIAVGDNQLTSGSISRDEMRPSLADDSSAATSATDAAYRPPARIDRGSAKLPPDQY